VIDQTSLQLHIPQGIKFDFNDLAGSSYKKVTEVRVCQAVVRALLRSRTHRDTWLEAGSVAFDVGVDIYSSPERWREAAVAQMNHLAVQDALTRRAWFLYEDLSKHPSTRMYHYMSLLCFS
jgi:protein CSF1